MYYYDISIDDAKHGKGSRVVLWVAGGSPEFPGSIDPSLLAKEESIVFDSDAIATMVEYLGKDSIDGITLTGGDPLVDYNRDEVTTLVDFFKTVFPKKTIWLYTGGLWEDVKDLPVMEYVDVLVDGHYFSYLETSFRPYVSSSNQRVIDVSKSRECEKLVLYGEKALGQ